MYNVKLAGYSFVRVRSKGNMIRLAFKFNSVI